MRVGSTLGGETTVRGNVRGSGSLEIFGEVEGDVVIEGDVVVGAGGTVKGNVTATRVKVAGAVQGDLRGTETVFVANGARVLGSVSARSIGIEPGANVRGQVVTEAPAAQPEAARPQKPPPLPSLVRAAAQAAPAPLGARREPAGEGRPPPPVIPMLPKAARARRRRGRPQ